MDHDQGAATVGNPFTPDREPDAPAVIEPGSFSEDDDQAPADDESQPGATVVYLPVAAPMGEGQQNATVQLRHTDAGELALPVFSSLDTLVANCGEDQAWISVTTAALDDIVAQSGAYSVAVDAPMPDSEQGAGEDA